LRVAPLAAEFHETFTTCQFFRSSGHMALRNASHATSVAQTVALEHLPRRAYFRAYRIQAGTLVESHAHEWCQFAFARKGTMHVKVSDSTMMVPPQYGMWLPASMVHSVWAAEDVDLESLYISAPEVVAEVLKCRVVVVSDLVREFIHYLCRHLSADYDESGGDGIKVQVLLDLLEELPDAPLNLPLPADVRLAQMCETIQSEPSMPRGSAEWARELNMSERTFARHFLKETGMTFQAWRQRLKLLRSLEMLKNGRSVTAIALDLGYSSTSAYIYAFRTLFGRSPKQFYAPQ
jgi:AraC-like DNA-binding protein